MIVRISGSNIDAFFCCRNLCTIVMIVIHNELQQNFIHSSYDNDRFITIVAQRKHYSCWNTLSSMSKATTSNIGET